MEEVAIIHISNLADELEAIYFVSFKWFAPSRTPSDAEEIQFTVLEDHQTRVDELAERDFPPDQLMGSRENRTKHGKQNLLLLLK